MTAQKARIYVNTDQPAPTGPLPCNRRDEWSQRRFRLNRKCKWPAGPMPPVKVEFYEHGSAAYSYPNQASSRQPYGWCGCRKWDQALTAELPNAELGADHAVHWRLECRQKRNFGTGDLFKAYRSTGTRSVYYTLQRLVFTDSTAVGCIAKLIAYYTNEPFPEVVTRLEARIAVDTLAALGEKARPAMEFGHTV